MMNQYFIWYIEILYIQYINIYIDIYCELSFSELRTQLSNDAVNI